jgi:hypothetical protein
MHVTLAYLPSPTPEEMDTTHQVVGNVAANHPALSGSIGGAASFPAGDDGVPHYAPVNIPGLADLRETLVQALQGAGVNVSDDHPQFTPHMTRTYLPEGEPGPDPVPDTPVDVPSLVVAHGADWVHHPFADTGSDQLQAPEEQQVTAGFWSDMISGHPGPAVNYDWCRFRHNMHCVFPHTLNPQATAQKMSPVWNFTDRGSCHRNFNQQEACPIGEPGQNARTYAKGPQTSGRFKGVSLKQDEKGRWYVHTHRARSDSYDSPEDIPQKDVDFIESTGARIQPSTKNSSIEGIGWERSAADHQEAAMSGLTLHILPAHAEHAARILHAEIAGIRSREGRLMPVELADAIKRHGGFSVKNHVDDGPTAGYMVSKNKSTEQAFPEDGFGAHDIQHYLDEHKHELSAPNAYFGAWHDPETQKVYLDVSHHYPSFEEAKKVGRDANQLALYDVKEGKTVYLGARGQRSYFDPQVDPNVVLDYLAAEAIYATSARESRPKTSSAGT